MTVSDTLCVIHTGDLNALERILGKARGQAMDYPRIVEMVIAACTKALDAQAYDDNQNGDPAEHEMRRAATTVRAVGRRLLDNERRTQRTQKASPGATWPKGETLARIVGDLLEDMHDQGCIELTARSWTITDIVTHVCEAISKDASADSGGDVSDQGPADG